MSYQHVKDISRRNMSGVFHLKPVLDCLIHGTGATQFTELLNDVCDTNIR